MRNETLAGCRSANAFVAQKLRRFSEMEHSFAALFAMMFSEKENVLYERSEGYRIVKTSYGQAEQDILRKAARLRDTLADVPANAVVGLYMENSLDWIETFWALLRAGFRPLLMNLRLDEQTLCDALHDAGAAAVMAEGRSFPIRTLDAAALKAEGEPLTGGDFGTEILVMSSGTSEHVKICAYTAEEFYHQIRDSYQIIRRCRAIKRFYHGQIKLLAFLPFYHIFGLVAVYIWFGFFSRTFVHLADMAPQTIVNTIRRHEVTHIFAVPLLWDKVYEQALRTIRERGEATWSKFRRALALQRKLARVPLLGALFARLAFREVRQKLFGESIRFLITGGSSIRPEVLAFFNGIGYRLADGYGMSEIGITSVELSASSRWLDAAFVGKPLSSVEYRINDEGELLVRGKAVARYVLEGGRKHPGGDWFNTHDLAACTGGHYQILGRRDDLVIGPAGENLNPNRIEERFRVEGVQGACLIGADCPVLLLSVTRGLTAEAFAGIERAAREKLAELGLSGQIGRLVFLAEPLLRGDEFKLNRRRLKAEYLAGQLKLVTPEALETSAEKNDALLLALRDAFAAALGKTREEVAPGADFFLDLGGTSLDYFALISQLQAEYGIDFPTEAGKGLNSAEALHHYIQSAGKHVDSIL